MKLVLAIIQPTKLEAVRQALAKVGVERMTVFDSQGYARQLGRTAQYRGHEYKTNLLRKITLAGQQTGVNFVLFRPNGNRPAEYHTELPVQISVQGNYHDVGAFLAELANLRRIVTVSNLKLTSVTKAGGGTTLADFTASAYSLNTAPAPNATASAGDPTKAGATPAAGDQKKGDKNGRKS